MSHLLRGTAVPLSRRSPYMPRGFPARFTAGRSPRVHAIVRGSYTVHLCDREEHERKYIRSTIVIDRPGTTLSMRRIFSGVIFKSLSTQARARSSIQYQLEFIDFTFACYKLCQRTIVFRTARYREADTNARDISDERLWSCVNLQYRNLY